MSLGLRVSKAIEASSEDFGFRYVKKWNSLIRNEPHGFSQALLASYPTVVSGVAGQHYSLVVGVRHDVVEDVVNALGLIYGSENQRATTTVSTSLEIFPLQSDGSYSYFLPNMATDSEVSAVAISISKSLETEISQYFVRYSSLQECSVGLNSTLAERSHYLYNNLEPRMYRAIAAARLSGSSDFDVLLERWLSAYPGALPQSAHAKVQDRLSKLIAILGVGPNNSLQARRP